jgi:hypothetical protein
MAHFRRIMLERLKQRNRYKKRKMINSTTHFTNFLALAQITNLTNGFARCSLSQPMAQAAEHRQPAT